ncbi:MAG TPA: PQQ-binding-like beta-propeller repeat protein [Acidimicrobiales bacterium]|nr:PQQ-binding-like beta-propeller repeat protein [Acidimicrobiales bacterium]
MALLGAGVLALAGCWPVPGQNADRTADNPFETGLTPATVGDLAQAWDVVTAPGRFVSDPVVSGAGVHVVVDACAVATLRPRDGATVWVRTLANFFLCMPGDQTAYIISYTPPYVVGDRVLYGYRARRAVNRPPIDPGGGTIVSTDLASGADAAGPKPAAEYMSGVRGDTLLGSSDRLLTFGTPLPAVFFAYNGDISLASLSGATPARTFSTPGGGAPVLGASAVFQAGDTAVAAYDVDESHPGCGDDGSLECPLWETAIDGAGTDPVLAPGGDSVVYVGTAAGTVYALDAGTGAVQWSTPVGAAVAAPPALSAGVLYVPTSDGHLVALAAGDGAEQWRAATDGALLVQPAVAGGVVYTGSQSGNVEAFAAAGCGAATCPALWSAGAGAAITGAPAVASGSLYVGTADGHVVAYRRP